MTHKEQAEELVKMFDECLNHIACGSNGIEDHLHDRAKQCALIAVDMLIDESPLDTPIFWDLVRRANWQAVKSEIEKL